MIGSFFNFVDDVACNTAEKCAHSFERLTGKDNFWLAKAINIIWLAPQLAIVSFIIYMQAPIMGMSVVWLILTSSIFYVRRRNIDTWERRYRDGVKKGMIISARKDEINEIIRMLCIIYFVSKIGAYVGAIISMGKKIIQMSLGEVGPSEVMMLFAVFFLYIFVSICFSAVEIVLACVPCNPKSTKIGVWRDKVGQWVQISPKTQEA